MSPNGTQEERLRRLELKFAEAEGEKEGKNLGERMTAVEGCVREMKKSMTRFEGKLNLNTFKLTVIFVGIQIVVIVLANKLL